MRTTRLGRDALIAMMSAGVVLMTPGCHHAPPPSAAAERFAPDSVFPAGELRIRVRAAAGRLSSLVETSADRIANTNAADPSIRRATLLWKIEAIPELQEALFRPDPYLALYDAWAFSVQMSAWMEDGAGKASFGDASSQALEASRGLEAALTMIAADVAAREDGPPRGSAFVHRWAAKHPIGASIAGRESVTETRSDLAVEPELTFLQRAGNLASDLGDVEARLDLANAYLPKMARWQGELMVQDAVARLPLDDTLKRLDGVSDIASRATHTLEGVPDLVARERGLAFEALKAERLAVMGAASKDLEKTLDRFTQERLAVAADLEKGRLAVLDSLIAERKATLTDLEEMTRRLGRDAGVEVQKAANDVMMRVALLGAIPVIAWIGGVLLILRKVGTHTHT